MILVVTSVRKGKDVYVTVSGFLDENATLPDFNEEIGGRLIVNLEGLTMINSLGTRRWLKWIKTIRAHEGVTLAKCSAPFILQANILQNFVPEGVTVESFHVPYLCTKCTHETFQLFATGKDGNVPDTCKCASCGGTADLDVSRQKYFRFLKAA